MCFVASNIVLFIVGMWEKCVFYRVEENEESEESEESFLKDGPNEVKE